MRRRSCAIRSRTSRTSTSTRLLTFELLGDAVDPTLGEILNEVGEGCIASSASETIAGYAAYGSNRRVAVMPLVEQFAVPLFDDGTLLRDPFVTTYVPGVDELGCGVEDDHLRSERSQAAAGSLPKRLSLTFYDPSRDYLAALMQANADAVAGVEELVELPVVMPADQAKAIAENSLARKWAERERLVLRLPPDEMAIEPGSEVATADGVVWRVEMAVIEQMAVRVDLRRTVDRTAAVVADSGTHLPSLDLVAAPTVVAVLDLPDLGIGRHDAPALFVAACQPVAQWRQVPLEVTVGGELLTVVSASAEAIIGTALSALPDGPTDGFDDLGTVEIELSGDDQWLENRDDSALANGANLAALGSELIQFGRAVPVGLRRFRLERLLRGRCGSEWATASHAAGEKLVMIKAGTLQQVALPPSAIGSVASVRPMGVADGNAVAIQQAVTGKAMRPPPPIDLQAAASSDGTIVLSWVRRSRLSWSWPAGSKVPLGESSERYRVTLQGAAGTLTFATDAPNYSIPGSVLAGMSGAVTVSVVQLGDYAESRPVTVTTSI
ncbi:hypothetical protein H9L15_01635 [Sphingomonas daechungensis]|uniref:Tip attachment protein J domain-containing protein n=1 Tax=Sphingomonas daechungensis TaxID=1176646 RepID=A0ABX6T2R9_9SPHN|nr:phage tail protein [Sphingomonas daechungensis]QNP43513.1 hypothetical protein H9L15_01635 [Sphingomonas daechungensis]